MSLSGPMTRERRKGRAHRLAATTLPAVLSRGGYAHAQHSREREDARRRRQMACGMIASGLRSSMVEQGSPKP